jgi:hypothetical protein
MKTQSTEKNLRILVVDDNRSIRGDFQKILAHQRTTDNARASAASCLEEASTPSAPRNQPAAILQLRPPVNVHLGGYGSPSGVARSRETPPRRARKPYVTTTCFAVHGLQPEYFMPSVAT